jgi:glycine/D-amino acid oxidase-like deaminating enzyme
MPCHGCVAITVASSPPSAGISDPIAWRCGMLRPAASAKQAADFVGACASGGTVPGGTGPQPALASVMSHEAAVALVPHLRVAACMPREAEASGSSTASGSGSAADAAAGQGPPGAPPDKRQRRQGRAAAAAVDVHQAAALHIPSAATLHPARYMQALWAACQQAAAGQLPPGSGATLHIQQLASLGEVHGHGAGPFDAVVVAAGAAIGSLAELEGRLPLDLCQGYTLDLTPPGSGSSGSGGTSNGGDSGSASSSGSTSSSGAAVPAYPPAAPSLLGQPYLASQGGRVLVVGATQRHGLSSSEALAACGAGRVPWAEGGAGEACPGLRGVQVRGALGTARAAVTAVCPQMPCHCRCRSSSCHVPGLRLQHAGAGRHAAAARRCRKTAARPQQLSRT